MDLCAGLVFCVMMISIWLDDAGYWKWLGKKTDEQREIPDFSIFKRC